MPKQNRTLHINDKNLVMRPKQEATPKSETKVLLLKTQHSHIVFTLDWLGTVLLWFSYSETDNLRK